MMLSSNNHKKIVTDYIFKNMPMPKNTILVGEAGFPGETNKWVAIRRNLILDVSKRINHGIPPYPEVREDDPETESYYLNLNDDLMEDMWAIISEFCPGEIKRGDLSCERGGDTRIYYNDRSAVVLRARFYSWRKGVTMWKLDMFALIR